MLFFPFVFPALSAPPEPQSQKRRPERQGNIEYLPDLYGQNQPRENLRRFGFKVHVQGDVPLRDMKRAPDEF